MRSRRASLESFARLLTEAPRTYVDLMALTGTSYRTAKDRLRVLRKSHTVIETRLSSVVTCAPVLMRIAVPKAPPPPPAPRVEIVASTGFLWPAASGRPVVFVAAELLLSAAAAGDTDDAAVEAVAAVICWPADELSASIRRVFGVQPRALLRATRPCS